MQMHVDPDRAGVLLAMRTYAADAPTRTRLSEIRRAENRNGVEDSLATAYGRILDDWAAALGAKRTPGEDDAALRARLIERIS